MKPTIIQENLEVSSLPRNYPVPYEKDLLFYIQRSETTNTVVYQLNRGNDGLINLSKPVNVFWIKYAKNTNEKVPLNLIQQKLAYGYNSSVINNTTIELSIVSYPSYKIYVTANETSYVAMAKFNDRWIQLKRVYVSADESGAFPSIEYAELHGIDKFGKKYHKKIYANDCVTSAR